MSEATDREKIYISEIPAPSSDAVQFILQCDSVSEDELKTYLSQHLAKTDTHLKQRGKEDTEKYIKIITKGLRKKSKQANALRFFYYGYYIRQLEELLERYKTDVIASARMVLVSKKHYSDILKFLYKQGCSQQKNISESLGINKSNLNRIMNQLLDNDLVVRSVGPRCVFFELSPSGYKFVRESSMVVDLTDKPNLSKMLLQRPVQRLKSEVQQNTDFEYAKLFSNITERWIPTKRNIEYHSYMRDESPLFAQKANGDQAEFVDIRVDLDGLRDMIQKKQHRERYGLGISDVRNIVRNEY